MLEVGEHEAISPPDHRNLFSINSILSYLPHIWQLLEQAQHHCISITARIHSTCWAVSEGKSISWHLFWIHHSGPPPPLHFTALCSVSPSTNTCLLLVGALQDELRFLGVNWSLPPVPTVSPMPCQLFLLLLTKIFLSKAQNNLTLNQQIIYAHTFFHLSSFVILEPQGWVVAKLKAPLQDWTQEQTRYCLLTAFFNGAVMLVVPRLNSALINLEEGMTAKIVWFPSGVFPHCLTLQWLKSPF